MPAPRYEQGSLCISLRMLNHRETCCMIGAMQCPSGLMYTQMSGPGFGLSKAHLLHLLPRVLGPACIVLKWHSSLVQTQSYHFRSLSTIILFDLHVFFLAFHCLYKLRRFDDCSVQSNCLKFIIIRLSGQTIFCYLCCVEVKW